jgi:hypothetical protein
VNVSLLNTLISPVRESNLQAGEDRRVLGEYPMMAWETAGNNEKAISQILS